MPPNDILIRDVPDSLRSWLEDEKHRRRLSLKEFVLQLLDDASKSGSRDRAPSLFTALMSPCISRSPYHAWYVF